MEALDTLSLSFKNPSILENHTSLSLKTQPVPRRRKVIIVKT